MDLSKRIVINTDEMQWIDSPTEGVLRKPLSRAGQESGHATSLVRFQKESYFKQHSHPLGEEIFVLDGVFSDESGDYGKGCYLRNPPGTSHSPFSKQGCTLFVKLHQFSAKDSERVVIDTNTATWLAGIGGLQVMPLHEFESERVALVKWPANEIFQAHQHLGGEEVLVLKGVFNDEFGSYSANTWTRSPHLSEHHPFVNEETLIWVKTGHLWTK